MATLWCLETYWLRQPNFSCSKNLVGPVKNKLKVVELGKSCGYTVPNCEIFILFAILYIVNHGKLTTISVI